MFLIYREQYHPLQLQEHKASTHQRRSYCKDINRKNDMREEMDLRYSKVLGEIQVGNRKGATNFTIKTHTYTPKFSTLGRFERRSSDLDSLDASYQRQKH